MGLGFLVGSYLALWDSAICQSMEGDLAAASRSLLQARVDVSTKCIGPVLPLPSSASCCRNEDGVYRWKPGAQRCRPSGVEKLDINATTVRGQRAGRRVCRRDTESSGEGSRRGSRNMSLTRDQGQRTQERRHCSEKSFFRFQRR